MTTEKDYRLDLLNKKTVSVVTREFITTDDGRQLQVGCTTRCCYANSTNDRAKLQEQLPAEYYNALIAVWGDTPIVQDAPTPQVVEI